MKKILVLLISIIAIAFTFSSCSKEDDPSTYTLKWNVSPSSSVQFDVMLFEYTDIGEKIGQHSINQIQYGSQHKFTASSRAVKVKVYLKMYIPSSSSVSPKYLWVQQVYYLNNGNTVIPIDGETVTGSSEP